MCGAIYVACPEQVNPSRQTAGQWLPGAGEAGNGEWLLKGMGIQFWVMKTVLELSSGD